MSLVREIGKQLWHGVRSNLITAQAAEKVGWLWEMMY